MGDSDLVLAGLNLCISFWKPLEWPLAGGAAPVDVRGASVDLPGASVDFERGSPRSVLRVPDLLPAAHIW